jgi:hypothetical protein
MENKLEPGLFKKKKQVVVHVQTEAKLRNENVTLIHVQ